MNERGGQIPLDICIYIARNVLSGLVLRLKTLKGKLCTGENEPNLSIGKNSGRGGFSPSGSRARGLPVFQLGCISTSLNPFVGRLSANSQECLYL
jgi:hypothetical protein